MIKLLHGDVVEQLKILDDNSVDAIIVDPPYNLGMDEWDKWESNEAFGKWCTLWGVEAYRVLKPGGNFLSFGCNKTYHWMACGLESSGFRTRDMIEWVYWSTMPKKQNLKSCHEPIYFGTKGKPKPLNIEDSRITFKEKFKTPIDEILLPSLPMGKHPGRKAYGGDTDAKIYGKAMDDKPYEMNENGRHPYNVVTNSITELTYPTNVKDVKKPRGKESIKEHQTQKPVELMRWLIGLTTKQGDVILDCFGGTGTTGEAALLESRSIILIDKKEEYINIIKNRLQPYEVGDDILDF